MLDPPNSDGEYLDTLALYAARVKEAVEYVNVDDLLTGLAADDDVAKEVEREKKE